MRSHSSIIVGVAAPLNRDDVDADQIVPSEYLKVVERKGIGEFLFRRWRFRDDGSRDDEFVLNRPPYDRSQILISGANFGIGSSRENAVWALLDYGILCVVASSFGDIFQNNAARNGLLCIKLPEGSLATVRSLAERSAEFEIDIPRQTMKAPGFESDFDIDAHAKSVLLGGIDEIAQTMQGFGGEIECYEDRMPVWAVPRGSRESSISNMGADAS